MTDPKVRTFFYGSYMNPAVLAEVGIRPDLPHPVLVQATGTSSGGGWPALCYLAPSMAPARAEAAYVERILAPARELGLPEWYLARLRTAGAP